jgi:hypothetical protein
LGDVFMERHVFGVVRECGMRMRFLHKKKN